MRQIAYFFSITALGVSIVFAADPPRESPISDTDREHWAYQPLKKPAVPKVKDATGWARTPIDAFILEKLERKALAPQQEASKTSLLRRVTFDLIMASAGGSIGSTWRAGRRRMASNTTARGRRRGSIATG
jgi:hypothetical protein